MNYEQLIEFISDKKMKLPEGEPYSGIPQLFIDEDERQWKLFFEYLKSNDYKKLMKKIG